MLPMLTTSSRISSAYALPNLNLFAYSLLDLAELKATKEFISEANWEFSSASKVPNNSIHIIRIIQGSHHHEKHHLKLFANYLIIW